MKTNPNRLVPSPRAIRSQTAVRGRCALAVVALLALLSLADRVTAQGLVPDLMSFQGYIEDGSGVPLGLNTPTNYDVAFRIFPAAIGGTTTWTEKQTVTFDQGNYSVLLGQGTALPGEPHPLLSTVVISANGSSLYVETTVTINGADAKILPRLRLLPSPYAFLARQAVEADWAAWATNALEAKYAPRAGNAASATNATWAASADRAATATNALGLVGFLAVTNIADDSIPAAKLEPTLRTNLIGPIDPSRLPSNLALKTTTNTFTANQRIEGDLTVTNNVNLGLAGELQAVAGQQSWRMVTGSVGPTDRSAVTPASSMLSGPGWSAVAYDPVSGLGNSWIITFNPPFKQAPIVVSSWHLEGGRTVYTGPDIACVTSAVTTNKVTIYANAGAFSGIPPGASISEYLNVNFIAIGLR